MKLDGRLALVTGAGSGIGRALAIELSRKGMDLILVGRRLEPLEVTRTLLEEAGRDIGLCQADVTCQEDRSRIADMVRERGRLDVLVNNAGLLLFGSVGEEPAVLRRQAIETNLVAPIELTLALLPTLERSAPSRVVNVGSMLGDIALPLFAVYATTKFGLRGWSAALRRELAGRGVGVTYVAPRGARTPAAEALGPAVEAFGMTLEAPEIVARQIAAGIVAEARAVYPRGPERLLPILERLFLALVDRTLRQRAARIVAGRR